MVVAVAVCAVLSIGATVRLLGARGRPACAEAPTPGRVEDQDPESPTFPEAKDLASLTTCVAAGRTKRPARCVISYSLFVPTSGDLRSLDRYVMALAARSIEAKENFPGWQARVYLDPRFTLDFQKLLEGLGFTVIRMPFADASRFPDWYLMATRLLVIGDESVDVFMSRDLDSALSPRDAITVWSWMNSGLPFLSIRDHPFHESKLMGGLWGGRVEAARRMFAPRGGLELLDDWLAKYGTNLNDQDVLVQALWPVILHETLEYDAYQVECHHGEGFCQELPMQPKLSMDGGYLGEVLGSRSVRAAPQQLNCSSLALSLQNIEVVGTPELAKLWVEEAIPHMRSQCLPP